MSALRPLQEKLSRCMVGLRWTYGIAADAEKRSHISPKQTERTGFGTAFLATTRQCALVVTAGHVLAKVPRDRLMQLEVLLPAVDGGEGVAMTLPHRSTCHVIDDEETGRDYGAIELSQHTLASLEHAGAIACPPGMWLQPPARPELYVVLGMPRRRHDPNGGEHRHGRSAIDLVLLPLQQCSESFESEPGRIGRFRAIPVTRQLGGGTPDDFLPDMQGLSGGPIFAIERTAHGADASLVAIQSVEQCNGVIGGCYVQPFLSRLDDGGPPSAPETASSSV